MTLSNIKFPALDDSVVKLSGVGFRVAEKLENLGITYIQDLLFHLPLRYQDKTRLIPIGALLPGEEALIEGAIKSAYVQYRGRRLLTCRIDDGSGQVDIRFFHFTTTQQKKLQQGTKIRCYGRIRQGGQMLEMIHPEYRLISAGTSLAIEETLTAIYPLTKGVQQKTMQNLLRQTLRILTENKDQFEELLPDEILKTFDLPDLVFALRYVHRPPADADQKLLEMVKHPAQQRLAFEELLSRHLSLQKACKKTQVRQAPCFDKTDAMYRHFIQQLGFKLTHAQQKVLKDIATDVAKNTPMLRLLQGDVGSGKTVVAAIAAIHALEAGYQVAIMAPTELLAEQHFQTFSQWFQNLRHCNMPINIVLITAKPKRSEYQAKLDILQQERCTIAIGTHALFQEKINFAYLGLVIIDEQQRFGVHQRLSLLNKKGGGRQWPHQLSMTATPIPRTLAMTLYADLDLSVIDSLPPGRATVETSIISNHRRDEVIDRIAVACHDGKQAYWVCTLIEESHVLQSQTAIETFEYLTEKLRGIHVGLIHGRMKNKEKEKIMAAFKDRTVQVLVATTVIEVGVDVANASLMIIENAERLGLFQLHQLRGRVGRGHTKSYCVLMYQSPLGAIAKSRLEIMRDTNDGFIIAEKDLLLRGAGDFSGIRQTGLPDLRIANIARDASLLPEVQQAAKRLQRKYPRRINRLIDRWVNKQNDYSHV